MLQVEENYGSLSIPPFGSGLKLLYKNKYNGKQEVARIRPGPKKNHYYAYFEQDDVDFEIGMVNSSCKDRSVCFYIEIMKKTHGFVVEPNQTWKIETLESNGKKLHFIRQSGEKGKSLVSSTASTRGISRQDASTILSQIKFQVYYGVKNFDIRVKYEEVKETKVEVTSQTTIDELKDKIAREIRHPVGNFSVNFNGKKFDDYDPETTLDELYINEDCQLICKKIEFPVQVKIKGRRNSTIIKVSSWDLVQDLKKKIEERMKIPVARQKLFYNNKELYFNVSALGWSGITCDAELELKVLELFPLQIKMIPSNEVITIPVCSRNTIRDVMYKIQVQEGISTQQQILYLHGSQLSKTEKRLEELRIKDADAALVFLIVESDGKDAKVQKRIPHECKPGTFFPIIIKKKVDGTTINLNVCSLELVGEVKEKICEKTGIPVQDQKLQCRRSTGRLLEMLDNFPLELYKIEENTKLFLGIPLEDVILLHYVTSGKEEEPIEIPFFRSETVKQLQSRIEVETGRPPACQRILFEGSSLRYGPNLSDYNIHKGSILEMYGEQVGGGHSCRNPSCTTCASTRTPDFSERGAITFGGISSQTFSSSCSFKADESIKIEPFIIELRLAGVPLLL